MGIVLWSFSKEQFIRKVLRLMNDLCVCIKYIFKGKVLEALESDIAIVGSQHESLKHIIAD